MIFVNFKNYQQVSANRALALAQICEKIAGKTGIPIVPCVGIADLYFVAKTLKGPVWVQHLDSVKQEKTTGFVTASCAKNHGAWGSLLNHAEHQIAFSDLKKTISLAKENSLQTMVLVDNIKLAVKADRLKPDYIGIEEPSLIGGKVAMSTLKEGRKKIKDFLGVIQNASPLVGAGINQKSDVKQSLQLGCKGVLIASAVIKASNPEKTLLELASAFCNST